MESVKAKQFKEKPPKPKYNMWQNSAYMIKMAWWVREKKVLFICLAIALLTVALNLIETFVVPVILSEIESNALLQELVTVIVAFTTGLILVSAAKSYAESNASYGMITVRTEIIAALNNKAMTTSYSNLGDDKFTKLQAKAFECSCSNAASSEAIWETLTLLLANVLGFIIYLSLFAAVQPLLILVVIITTLISYFVGNYLNGYGYRHREEEAEYERRMGCLSKNSSDFSAAKDVRIFGLRPWLTELYQKALSAYTAFHKKAEGVYVWAKVCDLVLTFLRNGAAYALLIYMVLEDRISVAEFLLYFTAIDGFTQWVTGMLGGMNTLYKQSLDICSIRECLEYPEPFKFDDGEHISPEEGRQYELRLENVTFRYPGAEKDALKNINLTLHRGEKIAVVGLNGAGKTTLIKLMCGFLDPTEGRVLLDGRDIREFNRADYYTLFSAVFRDFSVLAGSIAENIAQSRDSVDMSRARDCAQKAGLEEKIESLPEGYSTKLIREVYDDAVMLSGGETQRLMLARALYKDAPFMILDEPTAALDAVAEAEIYFNLDEIVGDKTAIYISHSLSSCKFCDEIAVFDGGSVVQYGTHAGLVAEEGGVYYKLWHAQAQYYANADS